MDVYEEIKSFKIRSLGVSLGELPAGSVVTLASGVRGVLVGTIDDTRAKLSVDGVLCVCCREEIRQVSSPVGVGGISSRAAVLSLTAATKAFGWIGGIVGASIASSTVSVQSYILGYLPWGTAETTLSAKLGMSVGSLVVVSSWIGFGIGVLATPIVYVYVRNKYVSFHPVTIFNETDSPIDIEITEITNVTICYNCVPSKPQIRTLVSAKIPPKGILLDIPIPNEETSIFKLTTKDNPKGRIVQPSTVYSINNSIISSCTLL